MAFTFNLSQAAARASLSLVKADLKAIDRPFETFKLNPRVKHEKGLKPEDKGNIYDLFIRTRAIIAVVNGLWGLGGAKLLSETKLSSNE